MSERLKILSSSGITGDFDMDTINGWSNLPLDVWITLEEINVAELRGESLAKENKTYTCDKCGKVGDSFTDMAQEECPADVNANHQIPIFGDQVKPRGIGKATIYIELSIIDQPLCMNMKIQFVETMLTMTFTQ